MFSKHKPAPGFIDLFNCFLVSIWFIHALIFIIFFLVLALASVLLFLALSGVSLVCLFEIFLASRGRPNLQNCLRSALLCPKYFGPLCVHFHLSPYVFLFPLWSLSWPICWFSRMLFSLHVFVLFPDFSLWLISSFLALCLEDAWYDFSLFKFVDTCFVA